MNLENMESFCETWRMRTNRAEDAVHSSQAHLLPASNMMKQSKTVEKRKLVSLDEGKEESTEAVIDRRLTIHCVVEEITSLEADKLKECPYNCRSGLKSSRENSKWWNCECRNIEMNSCVVIEASTSMSDLVKTALTKLGYPSNASSLAMGFILIRNWKALSLSAICPSPKMTVGDVLGELSMLVTLQIQILRPKSAFLQEIKDRLLSFLVAKSHGVLINSGCPLDFLMLTKLCEETVYMKKHMKGEPSEEIHRRFEAWLNHMEKNDAFEHPVSKAVEPLTSKSEINSNDVVKSNGSNGDTCGKNNCPINTSANATSGSSSSVRDSESPSQVFSDKDFEKHSPERENQLSKNNSSGFEMQERSLHSAQTKTRMRTSFDPDLELPKLLKWYLENPHPTRQQIHEYVQELNSLDSRRGRKKLDMNNVVYWFKNARAAQKRSEYRKFCNIPMAGTRKSCNLLKIPLGKSSGVIADEQITLSDDDTPGATENENSFRNGNINGKGVQVLGNWNSNGAGEAVLEMQITSQKMCQPPSPIKVEDEQLSDHDESSGEGVLSIAEDSIDNADQKLSDENHRRSSELDEKSDVQKGFENTNAIEEDRSRFEVRKSNEEQRPFMETHANNKSEDELYTNKLQDKNNQISHKKSNGFLSSEASLKSRYKSVSQNSILRHSFMYMSQCINAKLSNLPLSSDERRKRNRTFIDPLTEVPRLEQWFQLSTHPSHSLIVRYTDELNGMPYRKKFPKLETKNVQFWFKNRRAKNKRLNYLDTNNFLR